VSNAETPLVLYLSEAEATLLLDAVQRVANSSEFDIEGQGRAFEAWCLAWRISNLLPSRPMMKTRKVRATGPMSLMRRRPVFAAVFDPGR